MTRSIILAILAFGLLIVINIGVFGYLGFRSLSEQMVTEKLMEGLNETNQLLNQRRERTLGPFEDPRHLTREIAPRLRKYTYFHALVLLDAKGKVIHRETIGSQMVRWQDSREERSPQRAPAMRADAGPMKMIPVHYGNELPQDTRLAVEYNTETIRQEVETLRHEFNRKLGIAIVFSLILLSAGLGYVIWAYKRNQSLQANARKADQMAYVGTLSSGLAHEIRNPLNSMNMNVQLVQEELNDRGLDRSEEIWDMLESTRNEVLRLERLVSSFLAYARPSQLSTTPCLLHELLAETLSLLEPEIEKSGIRLQTRFEDKLPALSLDRPQMKQALINMIQNCIQVLQPGQTLEITTRKAGGDKALVQIRDEGPGISKEEMKNIFKEFYSTKRGGTGLGLPIALRIAELHGGGIKVESEIAKGTTFTLILPLEPHPS